MGNLFIFIYFILLILTTIKKFIKGCKFFIKLFVKNVLKSQVKICKVLILIFVPIVLRVNTYFALHNLQNII